MKLDIKKALLTGALLIAGNLASAAIVTSTYGDVDGLLKEGGHAGTITDTWLGGSQSWEQSFEASGRITSATIELAYSALGFYPPAGVPRLFMDGFLIGNLNDMDSCDGSAVPGVSCNWNSYASQFLAILNLSALEDGRANFTIETGYNDGWLLDYSRLTLITTEAEVPEPASIALLGVGAFGIAALRRKYLKSKNV